MKGNRKRTDFEEKLLPNFDYILRFSLLLAKNGRDAIRLMREAMVEAFQLWDESISEENCRIWMSTIITRRFFNGFKQFTNPLVTTIREEADESSARDGVLFPETTIDGSHKSLPIKESKKDIELRKMITDFSGKSRTLMILSYLEGFTSTELAKLVNGHPRSVETLLQQGSGYMGEELFAYLMEHIDRSVSTDRKGRSQ